MEKLRSEKPNLGRARLKSPFIRARLKSYLYVNAKLTFVFIYECLGITRIYVKMYRCNTMSKCIMLMAWSNLSTGQPHII